MDYIDVIKSRLELEDIFPIRFALQLSISVSKKLIEDLSKYPIHKQAIEREQGYIKEYERVLAKFDYIYKEETNLG